MPPINSKTVWSSEEGDLRKKEAASANSHSLPPQQQTIYLHRESKGRGGKGVTLVKGLVLSEADLTALAKKLKQACGSGGTIKDGVITIYNEENPDGLVLKEDYIDPQYTTLGDIDEVIEDGKVFVVGDNRSEGGSFDSREWGQLPQQNITGFAKFRLLPISEFIFIGDPEYTK